MPGASTCWFASTVSRSTSTCTWACSVGGRSRSPRTFPVVGEVRWRLLSGSVVVELRGPTACELLTPGEVAALLARLGPDPLRDDAEPDRAWQPDLRVAGTAGDAAHGPGRGGGHRQRLPRRGAVPAPAAARTCPGVTSTGPPGTRSGPISCILMRDGVRSGQIDTVQRRAHARGDGPRSAGRRPRRRGLRLPPRRAAVPGVRHARSHRVVAGRNLFWCPECQRADRLTG